MSLFTREIQEHLTPAPADALARASHPGMAYFANTGPAGATCRECIFWGAVFNPSRQYDYTSKTGIKGGEIKPHACERYRQLMNGQIGPRVPQDARACKYFEANDKAPERFLK